MNWDLTIKTTDVAIIIATILGPILAVQAQKWLERERAIRDRRNAIFRTLMATRAAMLSPGHVEAFNAVPVDFYGAKGELKMEAQAPSKGEHVRRLMTAEIWIDGVNQGPIAEALVTGLP